jgi:lauroyl/myristoyl acyltransferase
MNRGNRDISFDGSREPAMTPRQFTSWKGWFYGVILPALRLLGPESGDAALGAIGRLAHVAWPPRRRAMERATTRAARLLGPSFEPLVFGRDLAAGVARFTARDVVLEGLTDADFHARYDVRGDRAFLDALATGKGVVIVGAHLGAYIPALHWIYRLGIPLRTLIQKPQHVSRSLRRRFEMRDGFLPQSAMHLRRDLSPSHAAERILQARGALRAGMAVYLCGDIPWPSGRAGALLGENQRVLSLWADLAAATGAFVVPVFGLHRGGRIQLTFDPPWTVEHGGEAPAVARYLSRLGQVISAEPAQAVAFWTWPGYDGTEPQEPPAHRPRRRRCAKPSTMSALAR